MSSITDRSVLMVHNRYQQRGGEDAVFEAESALLERKGHRVHRLVFDNSSIPDERSLLTAARLAASTVWSRTAAKRLDEAIQEHAPDVVHFHNTFPLVSPAAYHTARKRGIRTVQTLHNYRLICPGALLYRDGEPCHECVARRLPLAGVRHGCYRDSRGQTAVVAAMTSSHRVLGTWQRAVDRYIALTAFSRQRFIDGGLPADRIVVKPNFLDRALAPKEGDGEAFLFVGRLTESKGITSMLQAWSQTGLPYPLRVAGGGPMEGNVTAAAAHLPSITALGLLAPAEVEREMRSARALIFPSTWYENFPMTLVEAFACGLPVIASRHGAMQEIIDDGRTGLLFTPCDADDLARKVRWALDNPGPMRDLGAAARREFETKYTGEHSYRQLVEIYGWT